MYKKIISVFLVTTLLLSSFVFPTVTATMVDSTLEYEVYPNPQAIKYSNGNLTITENVNLVSESAIDVSTLNKITAILQSKGITVTKSAATVEDKTNILLGIYNSQAYVDSYFTANFPYTDNFHPNNVYGSTGYNSADKKYDQYVLTINGAKTAKGTIGILGVDTTAVFYGLETLQMILKQVPDKTIRNVQFDDYATTQWRGFIEGFYGDPWSHQSRKSLMEFGGQFKANSYIYAPKDEPYHSRKWRELYPLDKLAELKELVDVGIKSKCNFVWAIHPGFNMIKWNDYDAEFKRMTDKFQQLYNIGVRQFAIFFDDGADQDNANVYKLLDDAVKWVNSKGDVKRMIFCPAWYCTSWPGADNGKAQMTKLAPLDIEVMWTGATVCAKIDSDNYTWVSQFMKREPYIWLNWPVNGHCHTQLLTGKGQMINDNVTNMSGIVSNPLNQAESSKVAIFTVLDNIWNPKAWNRDKSWIDSFKYLIPDNVVAQDAYREVSTHLAEANSSRIKGLDESEDMKDDLATFMTAYKAGTSLDIPATTTLLNRFDKIIQSARIIKSRDPNVNPQQALAIEVESWMTNLENLCIAGKTAIETAVKLQSNDNYGALVAATQAMHCNNISLDAFVMSNVRKSDASCANGCPSAVGIKRIKPFVTELTKLITKQVNDLAVPDATKPTGARMPISSFTSNEANQGLDKMVDGDEATRFFTKQVYTAPGAYVGVDLGSVTNVTDINILLDTGNDTFHIFDLEYSQDGTNWTNLQSYRLYRNPSADNTNRITKPNLKLKARYVRMRITALGAANSSKTDYWTGIKEFDVKTAQYCYTNVTALETKQTSKTGLKYNITGLDNITLAAEQYVGFDMGSSIEASNIKITSSTALSYEVSVNGIEWEPITATALKSRFRFIRAINKTAAPITTNITEFSFNINDFDHPAVTVGGGWGIQSGANNAYDGNRGTFLHTTNAQLTGKWVQLDLNGIAMVKSIGIVCPEDTNDFFLKGDLQISIDGTTWETVHEFTGTTIAENFPDHTVPYRIINVPNINKDTRYIRLITKNSTNQYWLRISEFEVDYEKEVKDDNQVLAYDGDASTAYTPKNTVTEFTYKPSDVTGIKSIGILQSNTNLGAEISIRTSTGVFTPLGKLDTAYKLFDTSAYPNIFEIKLTWVANQAPTINEIALIKSTAPTVIPIVEKVSLNGNFNKKYQSDAFKAENVVKSFNGNSVLVAMRILADSDVTFKESIAASNFSVLNKKATALTRIDAKTLSVNAELGALGDVNCDNTVSIVDALDALKLNVNIKESSLATDMLGDFDKSGTFDKIDTKLILDSIIQ